MITVFTFKDLIPDMPCYWAYDDESCQISGVFRPPEPLTIPCNIPAPHKCTSLQHYIQFVADIHQYTNPPTIVFEYSRETHPEYFI